MQKHLSYVLALLAIIFILTACTPPQEGKDHERVVTNLINENDSVQAAELLDSLKKIPPNHFPSRAELKSNPIDPPRN
ncbi:MAG: hypothetical protein MRZ79_10760 [Bacteroidia bacterium]|nr:hypothetical protein [Bacteroidia bacterium]